MPPKRPQDDDSQDVQDVKGGSKGKDRRRKPQEDEKQDAQDGEGGSKGKDRRRKPQDDDKQEAQDGEGGSKGKDRRGKGRGGKGKRNADRNEDNEADTEKRNNEADSKKRERHSEKNNGRGNREQGGKNNRGGKGSGKQANYQARDANMLLGSAVTAALPGLPAALGAPKTCVLCRTDGPTYVSLGPCGHANACWVCTLRLRALGGDRSCPVCREEASEVLITNDARTPFPSKRDHLPRDAQLGVLFANSAIERNVMRLFEYRCRYSQCAHADVAFHSLKELQEHVWYKHWRQFCPTCLQGRTSFICEQVLYSEKNFYNHCRWGDTAQTIAGRDTPAIAPHSWCQFCSEWLFDEDQLSYHMHSKHHLCGICEKMGKRNHFYQDFMSLASHYAEEHYVCPHRDCCHSGHRLTVFETEMELEMHRLREHADKSQMTDKEKKQMCGFQLAGFRSYADEQRENRSGGKGDNRSGGKGASRGNQIADDFTIQFCWPKDTSFATATKCTDENEEDESRRTDGEIDRYPDRDILSDHGNDTQPPPEIEEEHAGDENDSGSDEEEDDDDGDEDDDPNQLSKKLEAIPLQATVATAGRQEGMRNCLDAMQAVLRALFPGQPNVAPAALDSLRMAVGCLNSAELETFDKMRKDLARIGGESMDWEPLERVLALRPNFFRLFRSAKGTGIGPSIGPKSGSQPQKAADDGSEELWRGWKFGAQTTIRSLGREEQQFLRAYVHFCVERRKALHSSANPQTVVADNPQAKPTKQAAVELAPVATSEEFPTLGGGSGFPTLGGGSGLSVAEPTWGRRQPKQVVPKMAPARIEPERPIDAWDDDEDEQPEDEFPALEAVEQFPTLGKASARPVASSGWGLDTKSRGNATSIAPPPKATAKPKPTAPTEMDFPSLGGATSSSASKAQEWAKAKERSAAAAKAKVEMAKPKPEPPKDFQGIEEVAFPGLPIGGTKQKSGAKAPLPKGKAAASKAKAKAKGAAVVESIELPAEVIQAEPEVEIVPDSQLILIHDPLEAVARTEAAEAERRARKVKTKTGKRGAVVNPWTAGSPISRNG